MNKFTYITDQAHTETTTSVVMRQQGMTLVEILVAMVVLSIGLLGIAALQSDALRASNNALLQTTAVGLAADMADRIRANPGALNAYEHGGGLAPPPNPDCSDPELAETCTPGELAATDLYLWTTLLVDSAGSGLPGGDGTVTVDAAFPATYTVTVNWTERGNPHSYEISVQ